MIRVHIPHIPTTSGTTEEEPVSPCGATPPGRSPKVDIRVVLFTVSEGRLMVALDDCATGPNLPRGWPSPEQSLDIGARRIVEAHLGPKEVYLEQLYSLNVTEQGAWSIVVSYMALASSQGQNEPGPQGNWHGIETGLIQSVTDRKVLDYAVVRLRAKLSYTTIAFHLLAPKFTLRELQGVYEAILDHPLDKRNFRRRVFATGMLDKTPEKRRDGSHRPASLYQFRPPHDQDRFLTPSWVEGSSS
ncbi:MAG TPA: hypothetical protein VGR16_02425 [Thermomicrobiales bacterium]|nr:hypothetical protein [Thermomicrobiales bacterium]